MLQEERLDYLIRYLLEEEQNYILDIPDTEIEKKKLLRALMNVRLTKPISQEFFKYPRPIFTRRTKKTKNNFYKKN